MKSIYLKITTQSNLFIGGMPSTFEIGGVDLYTITDYNGYPYIPASSFKGKLRNIVRDIAEFSVSDDSIEVINKYYKEYLEGLKEKNEEQLKTITIKEDVKKKMDDRFEKELKKISPECLFGIQGFNDAPKLIFNDLVLKEKPKNKEDLFSIDSKNTIEYKAETSGEDAKITANPRTYKAIRPGVTFYGEIFFYHIDNQKGELDMIETFIKKAILEFNHGIHRLGNSGSRGYGKIRVEIVPKCDVYD